MGKKWYWMVIAMALLVSACSPQTNEVDIEMKEFSFSPSQFTVKAGAPVMLNIKNAGALEHDFLILESGEQGHTPFKEDEARVYWKMHLDARQEQTVQFIAPQEPGEYQVVCGIAGHLEQKMQSTMIVTE